MPFDMNPLGKVKGDTLDFKVDLSTHSVALDGYAVEKLAVLRGENGAKVRPLGWFQPEGSGHHRVLSKNTNESRSLIQVLDSLISP